MFGAGMGEICTVTVSGLRGTYFLPRDLAIIAPAPNAPSNLHSSTYLPIEIYHVFTQNVQCTRGPNFVGQGLVNHHMSNKEEAENAQTESTQVDNAIFVACAPV